MGSLAEDETVKRHSHPPCAPPPPPGLPWHAAPPPLPPPFFGSPAHHVPPHETVINGTTWYHQTPPGSSDSPFLPPPPSRYGSLPRFNSLNFDASSRSHPLPLRHPHPFPPSCGPSSNRGISPQYGAPSGFISAYSCDNGLHDGIPRGSAYHVYGRADSAYGIMPGYPYSGQHAYNYFDGFSRPYMPGQPDAYGTMPNPARSHGVLPSPAREYGSMQRAPANCSVHTVDYRSNAFYDMPPHAIRTSGKTFRQAVTWCGMSMPVTITSQAAAVVEWIRRQTGDLFGFDLEWKPNRLKGEDNLVALLQICGPADCLIVQLLYTDTIPKLLKEFLSNARKRLGGVGIRQDVKKLERDHDLACQGQVELGALASEKLKRDDLQGRGLKKLVDQVLGMTLVKVKKITMSNWEKEYLDEKQIEYACIDAWAAFAILQKLTTL